MDSTRPTSGSSASAFGTGRENSWLFFLPTETIENIFKYASTKDLFSLSLVCHAFHELAASLLYRNISHVLPDEDGKTQQLEVGLLTSVLGALTTSDYNYSRFIKGISMESESTTSPNQNPRIRAPSRGPSYVGGKLLNTLLLAVLKRVVALETFRWNIRVELNQSTLEALSRLPSLQNLHIRLPESTSTDGFPATSAPPVDDAAFHGSHSHHHHHQTMPPSAAHMPPNSTSFVKVNLPKKQCKWSRSAMFSRFSGLRSLGVLDMDDLQYIPDVALCISSSSSSLKSLKISFSDNFALKARRKPVTGASDSETISDADELGDILYQVPQSSLTDFDAFAGHAATDVDARKERNAHEKVLAQIFCLEESATQQLLDQSLGEAIAAADQDNQQSAKSSRDKDMVCMRNLREVIVCIRTSGQNFPPKLLETFKNIDNTAARYLEHVDKLRSENSETSCLDYADALDHLQKPEASGSNEKVQTELTKGEEGVSSKNADFPTANFEGVRRDKPPDALSDVIDLEHPDHVEDAGDDQEFLENDDIHVDNRLKNTDFDPSGNGKKEDNTTQVEEQGHIQPTSNTKGKEVMRPLDQERCVKEEPERELDSQSINDYIRQNHGIPLESLSIYLIPVRPSVLCRAVDISALKHLSLLNVGSQHNLWTMFRKFAYPSQLTSIHTDNVTSSFLSFVNSLEKVTELFMFERSNCATVEPFAPKTSVRIEGIRCQILRKHTKHLRRLVIRNEHNPTWNLNQSTVRLLTNSGSNLIELSVGLDSLAFHQLMRRISGLQNLVALQIFFFQSDNCNAILREVHSCAVDNILHYKILRLEYVGVCYASLHGPSSNTVTQLTWRPDQRSNARTIPASQGNPTSASASSIGINEDGKSSDSSTKHSASRLYEQAILTSDESEDEPDQFDPPKIDVKTGLRTLDTVGIKMWEKENWNLRL